MMILIVLFMLSGCGKDGPYIVVIDPGHGGVDVGAVGVSGSYEKDFNLSLALKVQEALDLDERISVYLTRDDDTYISQKSKDRSKFANDLGADLFISIHANAFVDSQASGTETYYHRRRMKELAETIHDHVVQTTGFQDREIKRKPLNVIRDTKMPAILLEIGFLSNPDEELILMSESFQEEVARAIRDGIVEYLLE